MDEMNQVDGEKLAAGGAVVGFGVAFLRKLWRLVSGDLVEVQRDRAETAMYANLRDEINRMADSIVRLRKDAEEEHQSMAQRIDYLEKELERLKRKRREAQDVAVEIYARVSTACSGVGCHNTDEIKSMLQKIIQG